MIKNQVYSELELTEATLYDGGYQAISKGDGNPFRNQFNHPIVNSDLQNELIIKAQGGDELAKEKLVVFNQRFVNKLTARFSWALQRYSLEKSDLVQEGNVGLLKAIESYDSKKGASFLGWASWNIKEYMWRAIANAQPSLIKLPRQQMPLWLSLPTLRHELENDLARPATCLELAKFINNSYPKFSKNSQTIIDAKHIEHLENLRCDLLLDADVSEADGDDEASPSLADVISDGASESVEDGAIRSAMLDSLLDTLTPLERQIIEIHFGINGETELGLKETAEKLGLNSPQSVSYKKQSALRKLKAEVGL